MPSKPSKKTKDEITVVAELTVTSSEGQEIIKSFDKAWHHMLELGTRTLPVNAKFNGFVRIED